MRARSIRRSAASMGCAVISTPRSRSFAAGETGSSSRCQRSTNTASCKRAFSTWPVFKGWLLWWKNAGIDELASRLRERLQIGDEIAALPAQPRFMFCATDLVAGDDWIFDASLEGEWDVATAAAISSCHPVY